MLTLYFTPNTCALATLIALEEVGAATRACSPRPPRLSRTSHSASRGRGSRPPSPSPSRAQGFNTYLCSAVHVAHAHRMRGRRWADDEAALAAMQRKVPQSVGDAFALIESELHGPWVLGNAYSICDGYLFTLAQWLEADGVDLARLPRVCAHRARVAERAAVQRALSVERGVGPAYA